MERKSNTGTAFVMLFLIVTVILGWHFASKYFGQNNVVAPSVPTSYTVPQEIQPVEQPVDAPPVVSIHQATVEAFYTQQVSPTQAPTLVPTLVPTQVPSIQLTTCMDTPIFSTTTMSKEYVIGMAAKGLVFDIAARSEDLQWVKLAQGNESYEFWIPSIAFCFE